MKQKRFILLSMLASCLVAMTTHSCEEDTDGYKKQEIETDTINVEKEDTEKITIKISDIYQNEDGDVEVNFDFKFNIDTTSSDIEELRKFYGQTTTIIARYSTTRSGLISTADSAYATINSYKGNATLKLPELEGDTTYYIYLHIIHGNWGEASSDVAYIATKAKPQKDENGDEEEEKGNDQEKEEEQSEKKEEEEEVIIATRRGEVAPAIDLGLSVLWAEWNLNTDETTPFGGYFAWGEYEEKSSYNEMTYRFNKTDTYMLTKDISGSRKYDAATILWGDGWRLPTMAEYEELIYNCKVKSSSLYEERGVLITGKNGNSIFLAAEGYKTGKKVVRYVNSCYTCEYMTSRSGHVVEINLSNGGRSISMIKDSTDFDTNGYCIRPVKDKD